MKRTKWIWIVILIALAAGGSYWGWKRGDESVAEARYAPVRVERGNIDVSIQSTATIRPEDIRISADSEYDISGKIEKTSFEGTATRLWIKCADTRFVVLTPKADFSAGQPASIHLPPEKIRVFPPESETG